jgi:mannan endo-1,4-beta-mannosidase
LSCSRLYKDDPTIIAWNMINEPRCESWLPANKDCNQRVQKWLVEMSKHIRSLDKNHLITIGSEGFYGDSTPKLLQYNPQAWAADMGQDFVMNTDIPDVDFATVHAWPDNCESLLGVDCCLLCSSFLWCQAWLLAVWY